MLLHSLLIDEKLLHIVYSNYYPLESRIECEKDIKRLHSILKMKLKLTREIRLIVNIFKIFRKINDFKLYKINVEPFL